MTTKTDEQERADFEAWANGRCELHLVNPAGRYSSATTQFAWEAYQAGRAALQSQDREDAERLDWLRDNSCDLRCTNVPTGGDDYSIHWHVIEHHMAKPHEREIGRSFNDDPRAAIDHARRRIEGES